MESSEFTMSHEDFPALPGSNPVAAAAAAAAAAATAANSSQVRLYVIVWGDALDIFFCDLFKYV